MHRLLGYPITYRIGLVRTAEKPLLRLSSEGSLIH
jgi:hypothetical protein